MNKDIDFILEKISYIVEKLYKNELSQVRYDIQEIFPSINKTLSELLNNRDKYLALGIQIPTDTILIQIKNFLEAYERMDALMLADSFKYEIYETLEYCKQINILVSDK